MVKNRFLQPKMGFKQKIALVLFGLFLFFVLLEAALRLGGFILLSIQEHRNLQSIKQKGAYRILCLGESTTQDQYPQFLEQALNQRNIGVRFSVIDKGRNNTNTSSILGQVESYLDEYRPDLVVTMMGINDQGEHIPFEAATVSRGLLLIRSFRVYKLAKFLWLHILTKAKEIGFYKLSQNKRSAEKAQTYPPEAELKEVLVEVVLTENALKQALKLNPKDGNAYVGLGRIYRNQEKIYQAQDAFIKAIEFNPKNNDACIELGWLYRDYRKYFQGQETFKQALELNPKNYYTYFGLGKFYREQGNFLQAEYLFKQAIELKPKNDKAYFELGWLYLKQDRFVQAQDAFKQAIELKPENDRAYEELSILYQKIGQLELAKEYAQKVNNLRLRYCNPVTVNNYHKLKKILDKRGIRLVCAQYPMRSLEPLKKIFQQKEGVIFVDNESVFKEALKKADYKDYFIDMFGGDFGHCTEKGNRLLAQNIARVILREEF